MKDRVMDKPAIEKLEDNIRQGFREWIDKPETKIEDVERFWEYKQERDDYFRIIEERGVQIADLCETADKLKKERDTYRKALKAILKVSPYHTNQYSIMRTLAYDVIYGEQALGEGKE